MLYTEPGGSNAASLLAQHNDPFPSIYAHRHSLPFLSIIEDNNKHISDKEMEPTNQINNNKHNQSINKENKHMLETPLNTTEHMDQHIPFDNLSPSSKELLSWHHR